MTLTLKFYKRKFMLINWRCEMDVDEIGSLGLCRDEILSAV
ncbi:hypothetical protein R54767_03988 [Paraburkholderia gardini]|uniref:Uncharacterized protein n=1 Tax=Paraburkholderia gardini TaxID=2823469 RepID=A0ABM8U7R6_9BURK|nr:hypothetical protein R54767_03988 [Paraburkholderia gardini]